MATDRSTSISANFRDRADSGAFYEAWVGAVLARGGLWTLHHPFTLAASQADVPAYAHTWDLDVGKGDAVAYMHQIEVKSGNLTFHNVESYPFEEMMVCSQASWERKWTSDKTQRDFLFVSRPTGAILWLPKGTPVSLNNIAHDSTRNQTYKVVKALSAHLRPLDEFIRMVKDAH